MATRYAQSPQATPARSSNAATTAAASDASDRPGQWQQSVSVVVPVHNEAGNISPQIGEIFSALEPWPAPFEVIYVNDGSTDTTALELLEARARYGDGLRVVNHATVCGQSTAIFTGVRAARHDWIVTLDGDGQNDAMDVPRALASARAAGGGDILVCGHRTHRRDTWLRRVSSRVANTVRRSLLRDGTPDTGCGLKAFPRRLFLELPYFDHMHRFLSALVLRQGGRVISIPVSHRPRERGSSKYGLHDRLWAGIVDMLGVAWLQRREKRPRSTQEFDDEL